MVGHHDGTQTVAPWNHQHDVPLLDSVLLVIEPAARPPKGEIRSPVERHGTEDGAANGFAPQQLCVMRKEKGSEQFEIPPGMYESRLRRSVEDTIGIVFVDESSFGKTSDGLP